MKKVKVLCGLGIIVAIIAGVLLLKYAVNPNVQRWYSYKVDVTNIHSIYVETKETQTLETLETSLQSKKIPYSISGTKLSTELFDYDVSNIEAVSIIKDQDFAKKFDIIDNRDFSKAKVEVDYNNGTKIETVSYDNIKRMNNKYYCLKEIVFWIYVGMIICIILCTIALFVCRTPRKEKVKKTNDLYNAPTSPSNKSIMTSDK